MVWNDEFEEGELNLDTWNVRQGTRSNNNLLVYRAEQVDVASGTLDLTVNRSAVTDADGQIRVFSSGLVDTAERFWFRYGVVAFRVWMPDTDLGLLPRVSLVGQDSEIRVALLGLGESPNQHVRSSLHYRVGGDRVQESGAADFALDLSGDYHHYIVNWTPTHITTYVDNTVVFQQSIVDIMAFQEPAFFMIDLGVAPLDDPNLITAPHPGTMMVDYVHIYDPEGYTELLGAGGVGPPTTLSPSLEPSVVPTTLPSNTPTAEPPSSNATSTAPSQSQVPSGFNIGYGEEGSEVAPVGPPQIITPDFGSPIGEDGIGGGGGGSSSSSKGKGGRRRERQTTTIQTAYKGSSSSTATTQLEEREQQQRMQKPQASSAGGHGAPKGVVTAVVTAALAQALLFL